MSIERRPWEVERIEEGGMLSSLAMRVQWRTTAAVESKIVPSMSERMAVKCSVAIVSAREPIAAVIADEAVVLKYDAV